MKENQVITSLAIEKSLLDRLKEEAKTLGLSTSSYIRLCILNQMKNVSDKQKKLFSNIQME